MGLFSWLFKKNKKKEIKLGLALGSGGAKGFAHLGALKAFEENGITFDYVAGTSIGSIIGAFYANGYSTTDIESLLKTVDFNDVANLFMINMGTSKLFDVIDRAIGSLNIEDLKKPFRAIGTIVDTGEEKVFSCGKVASALCASSSYPPFFKPVIIDGVRYIDGAFCNSIPSDVVKELGADVVVGIDIRTQSSGKSLLSKFIPTFKGKTDTPWEKGYKYSDVMLHPNLEGFTSVSFLDGNKMYEIGYKEALKKIPEIKEKIEAYKNKKR